MENYAPVKPERPVFLTVLCILTFLGSCWGMIEGATNYISADAEVAITQKSIDDAKEKVSASPSNEGGKLAQKIADDFEKTLTPESVRMNAIFKTIGCAFTFLGAFLMLKLKRPGFWIYVLGTAVSVGGVFISYGTRNLVGLIFSSGAAFIGILFVVLYSLNFKALK